MLLLCKASKGVVVISVAVIGDDRLYFNNIRVSISGGITFQNL